MQSEMDRSFDRDASESVEVELARTFNFAIVATVTWILRVAFPPEFGFPSRLCRARLYLYSIAGREGAAANI